MKQSFKLRSLTVVNKTITPVYFEQNWFQKLFKIKREIENYKIDLLELDITASGYTKLVNSLKFNDYIMTKNGFLFVILNKHKNKMKIKLITHLNVFTKKQLTDFINKLLESDFMYHSSEIH